MNKYLKKLALMIPRVKKYHENTTRLRTRADTYKADKERLSAQVHKQKAANERLRAQVVAQKEDRERLRAQIGVQKADKERLRAQVATQKADKEQLRSQVGVLKADKERLRTLVSALRSDKDQLKSQVVMHKAEKEQLHSHVEQLTHEIKPREGITYYSCSDIENFYLVFNGRIDTGGKCMKFCCEPTVDVPGVALSETAEESLKEFARLRAGIIGESVMFSLLGDYAKEDDRRLTSGCAKCVRYQPNNWGKSDGLIHYINLSMYPAPCQCKCIYCSLRINESGRLNTQFHSESYGKVFQIIEWVNENDMIATDATWQVSSGEITIHPYKDRLLNLVKGQAAKFYTNCFIFDEKIAENLSENSRSAINLSIDAGTPETWRKIKGVDNFGTVTDNLERYFAKSAGPGQITLKYIIMPGINDNIEDYRAVIEIMKSLEVRNLTLAANSHLKYSTDLELRETITNAAGCFAAMLYENDMTAHMSNNSFLPDEQEKMCAFTNGLSHKEIYGGIEEE